MSFWTEARIATAEKMWREGSTASTIAEAIGFGVSRNAVLGVMNRERARFPLRGKKSALTRVPRAAKPRVEKPAKPKAVKVSGGSTPNFKPERRSARLANLGVRVVQAPTATASPAVPASRCGAGGGAPEGVKFVDLTSRQCSWPLTDFTDADTSDMPCCGLPRRGGDHPDSSYCPGHATRSRGSL
jgi:GcrA cell cycle regulator